ncbi:MAG: hypothetical protein NVSMB56_15190 [Pyrinomonadaceae bacterium]
MNRRQFVKVLGLNGVALGVTKAAARVYRNDAPQIAITMDDFNIYDTPQFSGEARNRAILDSLRAHSDVQIALFVCCKYLERGNNRQLLSSWNDAGHIIANHTYSHWYYPDTDFQRYTADISRAEAMLKDFPRYRKWFRFPFLKEGKTAAQRDRMRAFLKAHNYRNGHVTIDAADWYVDDRLRARLKQNGHADVIPYKNYYLAHLWDRATFYNDLARKVLGRNIKHTLLVHHNVLNGLFLGDVLQMFARKGWKLINAEDAYTDPVFSTAPNIAPAGESLIWALAKETGKFDTLLRYPGEDDVYEKPKMDKLDL